MALTQYIQVGTDESFYFFDDGAFALILNQYGADVLAKAGNVYLNNDLVFYDIKTCLISGDGAVYLPVGRTFTPKEPRYLLLEDGSYLLLETGGQILLQRQ